MLSPKDIKIILNIEDEDISDFNLKAYIERYTKVIISELGDWAKKDTTLYNDPLFEECLLAIIACQLSRTNIEMIHSPSEYQVGDTTLKYNNTSLGLYGSITSWCDYYASLLSSLTSRSTELKHVQAFRRTGMSVRHNWWNI